MYVDFIIKKATNINMSINININVTNIISLKKHKKIFWFLTFGFKHVIQIKQKAKKLNRDIDITIKFVARY